MDDIFRELTLPDESLASFDLYKIKEPGVLWSNANIATNLDFANYCYAAPIEGSEKCDSLEPNLSIRGFADRYGGEGLGGNGGAGRAAYFSGVNVKGVGKTPLAYDSTDFFHSYGGLSVFEAVLEAAWGEVCNIALPFGGVRTFGIILANDTVPEKYQRTGKSSVTKRALAVRQHHIRPAHFLQNSYFRPKGVSHSGALDTQRVRKVISDFGRIVHASLSWNGGLSEPLPRACDYLLEVAIRMAKQMATARAKRLMHGSLTPSNWSICGGWLDFGSATAVSDYYRIIIPRGGPDFMHDEVPVVRGLKELYLAVSKFANGSRPLEINWATLESNFYGQFNITLREEFAILCGVHPATARKLPSSVLDSFLRAVREVINVESQKATLILSQNDDDVNVMPSSFGKTHLPSALFELAGNGSSQAREDRARRFIERDSASVRLFKAWDELRKSAVYRATSEFRGEALESVMNIESRRRLMPRPGLYRTNLYPAIERAIHDEATIGVLISAVVKEAEAAYANYGTVSARLGLGFHDLYVSDTKGFSLVNAQRLGLALGDESTISVRT